MLFDGLVAPIKARASWDDFWYNTPGVASLTGLTVSPETAMKVSAVWACVNLIADSLSMMPLVVYKRRPDEGRERATDYYLYRVLHDQPNRWQTAMEFRGMLTAHVLLRGNAYSRIVAGRRGFADTLIPLHPDRVTPERLENSTLRYKYRQEDGQEIYYTDEEIFHLRGLSFDGWRGVSVIEYARESVGLALATEQHGARVFSQGAMPPLVIKHPGRLSKEAQDRLKDSWMEKYSGLSNVHKPAVLEENMTIEKIGMTSEDAQYLQTRDFQVADVARWFRVPLHMIGETTKATSWGSGIEQLSMAFVIYTLLPWAKRWEAAISRDLIIQTDNYYAEHLFDALLRGDLKSRYDAYAVGRNWGWLSTNDVRRKENEDPIPGGDVYLQPLNMVPAGRPAPPIAPPAPETPPPQAKQNGHYLMLLREAAARVARKETMAMGKAAKRCADNAEAWRQAIEEFYAEHIDYVAQSLAISHREAAGYCAMRQQQLIEHGASTLEDWEARLVGYLLEIALGTENQLVEAVNG